MGAFSEFASPASRMEAEARNRAVETRVAECEDASVGGVEPIPSLVGGGNDSDNGPLESQRSSRSVELGRAEGEDATVRTDQPIAMTGCRRWGSWGRSRGNVGELICS